ncbi:MAG: phenylalanine--tRNA ligase subunit beta [Zavarzinella sp.]
MKVPLKWLAEHVDLTGIGVGELCERLTIAGLEVASVRFYGLPVPAGFRVKVDEPGPVWETDKIVVAKVLSIEKHPNADKLKLVQLDYGKEAPHQVVTGAPNISVGSSGQKVILGLTDCTYFDGHATPKVLKTLKPGVLRGITSDAMVMSEYELGITEEHEGIIILDDDAPVGASAQEYLGDAVLEIDILPNMARCLAISGIALEVAAIFGRPLLKKPLPALPTTSHSEKIAVQIADSSLSGRYMATVVENITVQDSPGWLKQRLKYAGMRPINNIVDITNYVMLDVGQPLHAFDLDVLQQRAGGKSPTITVRPATVGEKMTTLDEQECELTTDNLVIADGAGPLALAGVKGGLNSGITATTKRILLEAASFDPVSVRKTARKFNQFTDASTRFTRGVHSELVPVATASACQLFTELADGTVSGPAVDVYPAPMIARTIDLQETEIARLLGIVIPPAEVERILQALQYSCTRTPGGWQVTAPSNRLDIQSGAADLIEDIARIFGYDRLPSRLLSGELPQQSGNRALDLEASLQDSLARLGLQQVINYSLTNPEVESRFGWMGEAVSLLNPASSERSTMRRTLLAGLMENLEVNLKHCNTVKLFETGTVFYPTTGGGLPAEPKKLAILLTGVRQQSGWNQPENPTDQFGFYDLKGICERLLESLHISGAEYRLAPPCAWLHPARSAELVINNSVVGTFGEIHPKVGLAYKVTDRTVLAGEWDLDLLLQAVPERFAYRPIPLFQAGLRDIAIVVDAQVSHEQMVQQIRTAGGELLTDIHLFDVYTGSSIPEGKKSMAFALRYQSWEKPLTDKEIDKAHRKIEDHVKKQFQATIRGKEG